MVWYKHALSRDAYCYDAFRCGCVGGRSGGGWTNPRLSALTSAAVYILPSGPKRDILI